MARRTSKRTFGSLRRLPSGRYQARYVGPTGETVTAPTTFTARIDAEAWLAAERRRVEEPEGWQAPKLRIERSPPRGEAKRLPTLRDYAEQWIDQRRNSRGEPLRPLTRDKYRSSLRVHIYPTLGDLPLDEITRAAVRSWYDRLDSGSNGPRARVLDAPDDPEHRCLDDELLTRNPAYIRGAGVSGSRKSLRPASLGELEVMVEAMPERRRLLLLLATWCALRSGELRELRRSDIELGRDEDGDAFGWVHVRRAVVLARTGETERGRRTAAVVGQAEDRCGRKNGVHTRRCYCPRCANTCCGTRHRARTVCCFPPTATRQFTCRRPP